MRDIAFSSIAHKPTQTNHSCCSLICSQDPHSSRHFELLSIVTNSWTISAFKHTTIKFTKLQLTTTGWTLVATDIIEEDFWKWYKAKKKKRTISNAYQIPPAGQWRKLISRIQRPYKMTKLFNQKNFFWHDTSSRTCSINISILLMQSIRNLQ